MGFDSSCAITSPDGGAKCWGLGDRGQVGNGANVNRASPTQVNGLTSGVTSICSTRRSVCAVRGGAVLCWGFNNEGQLGDGTTVNKNVPTAVAGTDLASGVDQVTCGSAHVCARKAGDVYCWGRNQEGQAGFGSTPSPAPASLTSPFKVAVTGSTYISAGSTFTCTLTATFTYCWGSNAGQISNITPTISPFRDPTQVSVELTPAPLTSLTSGINANCAINNNGAATCIGANFDGALGDNSVTTRRIPVTPVGLSANMQMIGMNSRHTCATDVNGVGYCWGSNGYFRLGINSTSVDNFLTPQLVAGDHTFSSITPGEWHTCGIRTGGEVMCWGSNSAGALGINNPSVVNATVPILVLDS